MNFWISFPLSTFKDSADALSFLYPLIEVPMGSIMSPQSFPGGYESFEVPDALERLRSNQDSNFILSSEEVEPSGREKNRIVFRKEPVKQTEYFALTLEHEKNVRIGDLMRAAGGAGMTFAYKYDFWRAYWQSVEMVNTYENEKRPYAHLKQYFDPRLPPIIGHMIDISENPGHQRLTYSMKLMAAPEMWFGPGSWKYFDRKLVASFPDAQKIIPADGGAEGLLYVRLFDWDTPDYEAGRILHLQERFRSWTKMNEVEALLEEMLKK